MADLMFDRFTVDAPSLAYALASTAAADEVRVESQVDPTAPGALPLVIVGTSAPASVPNGPAESSAAFTISLRCYSSRRAQAAQICDAMYRGFFTAWRSGTATPYGWLSRITTTSTQPTPVQSDLEADNVHRFDCVLDVIARH
ncbi:hypothetical protein DEO23_14030 [Brachybacterium endophyticum]|uniref:DUF3168 domain-containing protein n=1 Tax=Brachybacterium endophyticum TaxID=2182385 RepID=A0A2U2RHE6_9MICO|nr:hypothetical protein [Brachybacterium endophyticum]PWH05195.1 hypothetical protein DEO23_14030 [Brachybacterium endophyticum]